MVDTFKNRNMVVYPKANLKFFFSQKILKFLIKRKVAINLVRCELPFWEKLNKPFHKLNEDFSNKIWVYIHV
jgi:hypothetical protein